LAREMWVDIRDLSARIVAGNERGDLGLRML
jgi:hypothetical protein